MATALAAGIRWPFKCAATTARCASFRNQAFSRMGALMKAPALTEIMDIQPGERVLDLGCGCGTIGVFAALRAGPDGSVVFVDSNVRATALAEQNARTIGLTNFKVLARREVEGLQEESFDVILANPPYYAHQTIAQRFIGHAKRLLKPGGRFFLVTKQAAPIDEWLTTSFADVEVADQSRLSRVSCRQATVAGEPSRVSGRVKLQRRGASTRLLTELGSPKE